jgi:hypothetical protein
VYVVLGLLGFARILIGLGEGVCEAELAVGKDGIGSRAVAEDVGANGESAATARAEGGT